MKFLRPSTFSLTILAGLALEIAAAAVQAAPLAGPADKSSGPQAGLTGSKVPFGGANAGYKDMRRRNDVKPPSATVCALREQTRGIGTTRQDASGKVQVFNDPRSLSGANGNIYGNCDRAPMGAIRPGTPLKPTSAYNARTNTLKAATDGYMNRSATSSMMPKKLPSMYDPATGTLKPAKRPDAYQLYQQ